MSKIPYHIVLFPDGNRRWAKKRGLPTIEGHRRGYENLIKFCEWCKKRGVKIITAFGFSTENWKRSQEEVSYLIKLLEEKLLFLNKKYFEKIQKEKIRITVIGQKEKLPEPLQKIIKKTEEITKNNKEFFLNLAISYGGRWDIIQAVQKIIKDKISPEQINESFFKTYLSTANLPDPDLILRVGGEKRLSNFLLWQAAHSELYFSEKLWPDFNEKDLDKALEDYCQRQRRFGK